MSDVVDRIATLSPLKRNRLLQQLRSAGEIALAPGTGGDEGPVIGIAPVTPRQQ